MALNVFLELDGIAGESEDLIHKGLIEIASWSWGLSETTPGPSSVGEAGKVTIQNLVIHKNVDIASPLLIRHCAQGQTIASGVMFTRTAPTLDPTDPLHPGSGNIPGDFLLLKMTDVTVVSVDVRSTAYPSVDPSGETLDPSEILTLAFKTLEFEYRRQLTIGAPGAPGALGAPVTVTV
jgi:type VI secretion system secreted protein Hcp